MIFAAIVNLAWLTSLFGISILASASSQKITIGNETYTFNPMDEPIFKSFQMVLMIGLGAGALAGFALILFLAYLVYTGHRRITILLAVLTAMGAIGSISAMLVFPQPLSIMGYASLAISFIQSFLLFRAGFDL